MSKGLKWCIVEKEERPEGQSDRTAKAWRPGAYMTLVDFGRYTAEKLREIRKDGKHR
jgi:hypothetical protein